MSSSSSAVNLERGREAPRWLEVKTPLRCWWRASEKGAYIIRPVCEGSESLEESHRLHRVECRIRTTRTASSMCSPLPSPHVLGHRVREEARMK